MRFTTFIVIASLITMLCAPEAFAIHSSIHKAEDFLNESIDKLSGKGKLVCKATIACYALYLAWPYLKKVVHDTSELLNRPTLGKCMAAAKHTFILTALAFIGFDFGNSFLNDLRRRC